MQLTDLKLLAGLQIYRQHPRMLCGALVVCERMAVDYPLHVLEPVAVRVLLHL